MIENRFANVLEAHTHTCQGCKLQLSTPTQRLSCQGSINLARKLSRMHHIIATWVSVTINSFFAIYFTAESLLHSILHIEKYIYMLYIYISRYVLDLAIPLLQSSSHSIIPPYVAKYVQQPS